MKEHNRLLLGDLVILLFLVYMYLWRIGPWYHTHRLVLSVYFLSIAIIFYLFVFKVLKLNHWAVLLGTLVFSFCGSDLSLAFNSYKIPYPGMLTFLIAGFSFCAIDRKRRFLCALIIMTFLLSYLGIFIRLPTILISAIRLLFNLFFGILVAYGFNEILFPSLIEKDQHYYKKIQNLFYKVWLYTLLIVLPIAYTVFIIFVEIGKELIPNIVSTIVMFEIFLGWALIISNTRYKAISQIIPFMTVFLAAADIFTYWVAK